MSTKAGSTTRREKTGRGKKKGGGSGKDPPKLSFPFPPPDFDPLQVSPADLGKYGLPQGPDGELVMYTDPLDLEDLLRQANE